jgi:hypothetical protein
MAADLQRAAHRRKLRQAAGVIMQILAAMCADAPFQVNRADP